MVRRSAGVAIGIPLKLGTVLLVFCGAVYPWGGNSRMIRGERGVVRTMDVRWLRDLGCVRAKRVESFRLKSCAFQT
jgi:hypothetical protein